MTTTAQITDSRDSQTYDTVSIGTQNWIVDNMNYYTARFSSYWNNDSIEYSGFGRLYAQFAADTICPSGYHLPTDAEWQTLESYVGMSDADTSLRGYRESGAVGKHLKADYLDSYWTANGFGDDAYDFAAQPVGFKRGSSFYGLYANAYYWTATSADGGYWYRSLYSGYDGVDRNVRSGSLYMSVRCIAD